MVRDGYIYGLSLLVVALLLAWATGNWAWGIAPVLLAAFFLWFFRDPQRTIPSDPGLIVSPGDGLVTETITIASSDGPRQRISIFLNVFNVHVKRAPIGGAHCLQFRRGRPGGARAARRVDQVRFQGGCGGAGRGGAQGEGGRQGEGWRERAGGHDRRSRRVTGRGPSVDVAVARANAKARLRRGMFLLPSLFTCGNIAAGFFSITETIRSISGDTHTHLDWAAIAILFAIPFDTLDGRIARMTNTTSEFGKELDSLADAITFGMAPALLALIWGFHFLPDSINPQLLEHLRQ